MAYQVLARQWRPRLFEQMVGQEAVLKSLIHSLDQNRLHHAYLFTGTRGVGKTSLARIMAKCLNCEKGVSSKPCGICSTCLEIDQGRSIDLIEIDAASKTKVEDTRELLDNVQYAPTQSRFKIYLIDEVHMLSLHSFNALLKTLEEPPSHVKFLLATTDPKKLPITVLSRCLQFCLKNIDPAVITLHLEKILQHEKISYQLEALKLIARAATGSMRDALSLLDQAISYGEGSVQLVLTQAMLGMVDSRLIINLLQAIASQNSEKTQNTLSEITELSTDFLMTAHRLAELLFEISQSQIFPGAPEGQFLAQSVHELAKLIPAEWVQLYYQMVIKAQEDIPLAPTLKLGFEMLVLRLYAFAPGSSIGGSTGSIRKMQGPVQLIQPLLEPIRQIVQIEKSPEKISEKIPEQALEPIAEQNGILNWPQFVSRLNIQGMLKQLASHCALIEFSGNRLVLSVAKQHASFVSEALIEKLEKAVSVPLGRPVSLEIRKGELASEGLITPAQVQVEQKEIQQKSAEDSLEEDAVAQYIQSELLAKLTGHSIEPMDSEQDEFK